MSASNLVNYLVLTARPHSTLFSLNLSASNSVNFQSW